jgi:IS1 family transposase
VGRVYGYVRLKSIKELEFFDEYQVNYGQPINKMFIDVVLGKTTTKQNLDKMLGRLKKSDVVVLKTFSNVCSTFQEIYQLVRAVHQKGATIDIVKKSCGEHFYCTDEGFRALEILLTTQTNMNNEPRVRITNDPKKVKLLGEIYDMYLKYKLSAMTVKEISKELDIDEQLFYLYARSLA